MKRLPGLLIALAAFFAAAGCGGDFFHGDSQAVTDLDLSSRFTAPAMGAAKPASVTSSSDQYAERILWQARSNGGIWAFVTGPAFPAPFPLPTTVPSSPSIKTKLGITTSGTAGVTDTFNALSDLIAGTYPYTTDTVQYRAVVILTASRAGPFQA
jgi:hypothetical protein